MQIPPNTHTVSFSEHTASTVCKVEIFAKSLKDTSYGCPVEPESTNFQGISLSAILRDI